MSQSDSERERQRAMLASASRVGTLDVCGARMVPCEAVWDAYGVKCMRPRGHAGDHESGLGHTYHWPQREVPR
jgi:hypothetical protein